MSSKPILGYWPIRGLAQPIRNLLVLAGVDFVDKTYEYGPGKSFAEYESLKMHWNKEKYSLGLEYPNLPYLIEGELKLTQSKAITRHIARQHNLVPKDENTRARCEMLEEQINEYFYHFAVNVNFSQNYETERDKFISTTMPPQLDGFNKFLGDKEWFGSELSYIDVVAHYYIDLLRKFSPSSFDKYPKLTAFLSRFEALPRIKKYFESDVYKTRPLFAPIANWGNKVI